MAGEFTDDGTETHFNIGSQPAYVKVKNFFIHLHSRIIEQSCNEDSSKIYVEGSVIDLMYIGRELFFVKGEEWRNGKSRNF